MTEEMQKALSLLTQNGCTCAACRGEEVYTSRERGVKPLLDLIDAGATLEGCSVADRVVGRAAAFLYVRLRAKAVHALVMSRPAQQVFARYGLDASCDTLTEAIINRTGTGLCPMESAVMRIEQPEEAEKAVRETLARLMEKEN